MVAPLAHHDGNPIRCIQSSRQHQSIAWPSSLSLALRSHLAVVKQERWYIFDHKQVHSLAQRAIANHPNNTRGVIDEIVSSLSETHGAAINTREEWVFNNAGGAMGAMYVIHGQFETLCALSFSVLMGKDKSQYNRVLDRLWHTARNRRSFR